MINSPNYYNKIPVHYCTTCLSLKILTLDRTNIDFCGNCGNTTTSKASNNAWEELFKTRYGKYYLDT